MKPTPQQILSYRCRVLANLAVQLLTVQNSAASKKGLRVISGELDRISADIANFEPEESDIDEVLARV
jgi:hypothetical protein